VSDLAGGELELELGNERGNEDVWKVARSGAVLRVCSSACFIGRRGRGAGWPDLGRGMAVTRSWSCSSGRDGRGGVGVVCRWCGDVGGALASQGDEGRDGEQWRQTVTRDDRFSSTPS
jgi:hypothetical protein